MTTADTAAPTAGPRRITSWPSEYIRLNDAQKGVIEYLYAIPGYGIEGDDACADMLIALGISSRSAVPILQRLAMLRFIDRNAFGKPWIRLERRVVHTLNTHLAATEMPTAVPDPDLAALHDEAAQPSAQPPAADPPNVNAFCTSLSEAELRTAAEKVVIVPDPPGFRPPGEGSKAFYLTIPKLLVLLAWLAESDGAVHNHSAAGLERQVGIPGTASLLTQAAARGYVYYRSQPRTDRLVRLREPGRRLLLRALDGENLSDELAATAPVPADTTSEPTVSPPLKLVPATPEDADPAANSAPDPAADALATLASTIKELTGERDKALLSAAQATQARDHALEEARRLREILRAAVTAAGIQPDPAENRP